MKARKISLMTWLFLEAVYKSKKSAGINPSEEKIAASVSNETQELTRKGA